MEFEMTGNGKGDDREGYDEEADSLGCFHFCHISRLLVLQRNYQLELGRNTDLNSSATPSNWLRITKPARWKSIGIIR
jgi:hypothetical protein